MRVLVLNAGSSSLKASAIDTPDSTVATAELEWGSDATLARGRKQGILAVIGDLQRGGARLDAFDAVGHRVVHGGVRFSGPAVIDDAVLGGISEASALAPLHNAVALETIRAARRLLPGVPHVAAFDTSFHRTLPPEAVRYPVPKAWFSDWGVRRYGFHGLSVEWSTREAVRALGRPAHELGLIVAHLGSGCSVTAVWQGRSVDTSLGETPLEGLMMGTRSGSVDPGMLMRLLIEKRLNATKLERALEHDSGLLGVSGISGDMHEVQAAALNGNEDAQLALAMFVRRAAAAIGAAATNLPRLDALIFTGGIGEHATDVRAAIVARLASVLSATAAPILVIEAREDLVIAAEVSRLVPAQQ